MQHSGTLVKQRTKRRHRLTQPALPHEVVAQLRGFGLPGMLAIAIITAAQIFAPLDAVLVLVWANLSRTPWHKIGFARPKSWTATLTGGLVFGVCFKLLMKTLIMPLLGAEAVNHAYQFLVANKTALVALVPVMIIKAGVREETYFRGYLFERLGRLFGETKTMRAIIVLLTSILFAVLHY